MKVNTVVYQSSDWKVKVHTSVAQYRNRGQYWTCCSLVYSYGASVILVSKYTDTEALAAANHVVIAAKARDLFSLKDTK